MIKRLLKCLVLIFYNVIYYFVPINRNIIIFESGVGNNYAGNPKAIYEEMIKSGLDSKYQCIWVLNNTQIVIPGRCKKVKRLFLRYFYYMAVAGYWVCDSRQPIFLKKKIGNIYIQTWHGTPLKKIGLDMNFVNMATDKDIKEYKENFIIDVKKWDYLISQNDYSSRIFRRCFMFDNELLEIGYPRNDILFNEDTALRDRIKRKLNIHTSKKIILYAPTWRDSKYKEDGTYEFMVPIDLEGFASRFGEEYVLILKAHYLVHDKVDVAQYMDCIRLCTNEVDIQELYLISDLLITDYSSAMFDYSILKKPIIFYLYDIDEYRSQDRELYFDMLLEIPGPVAKSNDALFDLLEHIQDISYEFTERYKQFCDKYNRYDNGSASKKVVDLIISSRREGHR